MGTTTDCLQIDQNNPAYKAIQPHSSTNTSGQSWQYTKLVAYTYGQVQSSFSDPEWIGSKSLKEFEEAFRNALEEGKGAKKAAHNCKEACLKSFNDRCADVIVEQANCNTFEDFQREKLQRAMDNLVPQVKKEHDKKVREEIIEGVIEGAAVGAAAGVVGAAVATGALPAAVAAKIVFVGGKYVYDFLKRCDSKSNSN